jgi:uncharacterized membrane protein
LQTPSGRIRRPPLLVRVVRARPRLFACAAIGVVVFVLVALVFHVMGRSDIARIRQRAAEQDEGQFAILVLTVAAALASLAAAESSPPTASCRSCSTPPSWP